MISLTNITKTRYVEAKFFGMRKPQTFLPHRASGVQGQVIVQSDKCIGVIDLATGAGRFTKRGCYFVHLAMAEPVQYPPDFVEAVKQAIAVYDGLTTKEVA